MVVVPNRASVEQLRRKFSNLEKQHKDANINNYANNNNNNNKSSSSSLLLMIQQNQATSHSSGASSGSLYSQGSENSNGNSFRFYSTKSIKSLSSLNPVVSTGEKLMRVTTPLQNASAKFYETNTSLNSYGEQETLV